MDEDGDGRQDAGEAGIAGVTVELVENGSVVAVTTTNVAGEYVFPNVATGTYTVRVVAATLPAALQPNPTYDEDGVATPNQSVVVLAAGDEHLSADFGYNYVPPGSSSNPPPGAPGAIGDRIWNDADGDGAQDPGEAGIANVVVNLYSDPDGNGIFDTLVDSVLTDPDGRYSFDDLPPGAYVVEVEATSLPAGFNSIPSGDPDGDGDNVSDPIVLAPGDVYLEADFGYRYPAGKAIGDRIYLDANGDGGEDAGEPGIPGVTVALLDANGKVIATTITDAAGSYRFAGLPDGNYTVVVTDTENVLAELALSGEPSGGNGAGSAVLTLSGADRLDQDFGYAPPGHDSGEGLIGDTIFLDRNGDGSPDPGEGLEGITVELRDDMGAFLGVTVTDENGNYYFGGLGAGDYTVRVDVTTLPPGVTNSVDPDGGTLNESDVSLGSGQISLDQDFGYRAATPNTIAGTIWNDPDASGTLDGDEPGAFAGVTVVLRDLMGNVVARTVSDANGDFAFTGLPDGTYVVDVTDDGNVLGGLSHSNGPNPGGDNNSQVELYTVTVAGGETNETADFGYYRSVSAVGNRIFLDLDEDGVQDPGEPGIAGVPVTLTIRYPNGDVVQVTTRSDANGFYRFSNLLLDENYNGDGMGAEPTFEISVQTPVGMAPSPLGVGGPRQDSDDSSGTGAEPRQGDGDVAPRPNPNDEPDIAGIDFGFFPVVDLMVSKSVQPAQARPGDIVTYRIVVSNAADASTATNVAVVDVLPAGLTYVAGSIAGGSTRNASDPHGAGLRWTIDSMAPAASVTLTFRASIDHVGVIHNLAEVVAVDQTDRDSTPDNRDGGDGPDEDDDDSVTLVATVPAPAPAMSSIGLALSVLMLLAVAFVRSRRRTVEQRAASRRARRHTGSQPWSH